MFISTQIFNGGWGRIFQKWTDCGGSCRNVGPALHQKIYENARYILYDT